MEETSKLPTSVLAWNYRCNAVSCGKWSKWFNVVKGDPRQRGKLAGAWGLCANFSSGRICVAVVSVTDVEGEGSLSVLSLIGKCRSARTEHRGQKLLLVVACRLWNQIDTARVVTESEKCGIHVPEFLLVVIWGPWTCILSFVCWTGPTCGDQQLGPVQ